MPTPHYGSPRRSPNSRRRSDTCPAGLSLSADFATQRSPLTKWHPSRATCRPTTIKLMPQHGDLDVFGIRRRTKTTNPRTRGQQRAQACEPPRPTACRTQSAQPTAPVAVRWHPSGGKGPPGRSWLKGCPVSGLRIVQSTVGSMWPTNACSHREAPSRPSGSGATCAPNPAMPPEGGPPRHRFVVGPRMWCSRRCLPNSRRARTGCAVGLPGV